VPGVERRTPVAEKARIRRSKLTRTSSSVTLETAAANLFAGSRRIAPRLHAGVLPPLRDTTWLLEGNSWQRLCSGTWAVTPA
jgi:hypothetical protein